VRKGAVSGRRREDQNKSCKIDSLHFDSLNLLPLALQTAAPMSVSGELREDIDGVVLGDGDERGARTQGSHGREHQTQIIAFFLPLRAGYSATAASLIVAKLPLLSVLRNSGGAVLLSELHQDAPILRETEMSRRREGEERV
jgi:hypothetical protein